MFIREFETVIEARISIPFTNFCQSASGATWGKRYELIEGPVAELQ